MSRSFDLRNDDIVDLVYGECTRRVREGALLVVPTDTVYGIAADAFSPQAVASLLAAKGRGRDMPPPVLIGDPGTLMGLADGLSDEIFTLTKKFWPGPLTLICRAQPSLDWDLGETHGTVALRMPDEPRTLALLKQTGPLAVSSANTSGDPAALSVEEAQAMLGDAVDIYLDAGTLPGLGSSTIVDMTAEPPRIVRRGPISHAELLDSVPGLLDLDDVGGTADTTSAGTTEAPAVPGAGPDAEPPAEAAR